MRYKKHNIPDEKIDKLMEKLDISLEEACETILADMDVVSDKTVEELTKKAQKNRITTTIHSAKGEKKERKAREKKENPVKKAIITMIFETLTDPNARNDAEIDSVFVKNDEKYIDFCVGNRNFTINLVEHRPKKG